MTNLQLFQEFRATSNLHQRDKIFEQIFVQILPYFKLPKIPSQLFLQHDDLLQNLRLRLFLILDKTSHGPGYFVICGRNVIYDFLAKIRSENFYISWQDEKIQAPPHPKKYLSRRSSQVLALQPYFSPKEISELLHMSRRFVYSILRRHRYTDLYSGSF